MGATSKQQAEQRYVPSEAAPRQARAFLDEFLEGVGAAAMEDRADVLTTDLVADAVRHAPTQVTVRVVFDHAGLRVEVSDDPGLIADPHAGEVDRRRSREHRDELACRWGSEFGRDITTTWFELAA